MSNPTQLVSKLWNYCSVLRDDGLSYGDYVEQLTYQGGEKGHPEWKMHNEKCRICGFSTFCILHLAFRLRLSAACYLLFLKMAHEQTLPPWKKPSFIPAGY